MCSVIQQGLILLACMYLVINQSPETSIKKTQIATTRTHVRFSYFALILSLGRQFSEAEVGVVFSDADVSDSPSRLDGSESAAFRLSLL